MKIHWIRVLLGGFLIEVLLAIVLVGGFALAGVDLAKGISPTSAAIIGVGCFAGALVVAMAMTRGIQRPVFHGLLMGVVATILYVGLVAGSGQMSTALASYGPATFVIVNGVRIVGAAMGGALSERGKAAGIVPGR